MPGSLRLPFFTAQMNRLKRLLMVPSSALRPLVRRWTHGGPGRGVLSTSILVEAGLGTVRCSAFGNWYVCVVLFFPAMDPLDILVSRCSVRRGLDGCGEACYPKVFPSGFFIRVIQIDQISSFLGLISSKSCGDFWGFCKIGMSTFTSCAINDMWYRPV